MSSSPNIPSKVRFALVGCGVIAKTQVRALLEMKEQVDLVCLCDIDESQAQALSEEFDIPTMDLDTLCRDTTIEAVTVCTPSGLHADLAVRLMEAGKHVIVEKPMDITVEACQRMLDAANDSGRKLAVISQHRFDPSSRAVIAAREKGDLGELVFVEARVPWFRSQEYYDSAGWRGTMAMDGGGCMMNQGIHTIDLMLWMAGPVRRVSAQTRICAHERIEVEDLALITVEFENGMLGSVMASTSLYPGYPCSLGLYGQKGSALIEGDGLKTLAVEGKETLEGEGANAHARQVAAGGTRSATAAVDAGESYQWSWGDAHQAQFQDFVEAIREDRSPAVDGHCGLAAVEFILACYESAKADGQWVHLTGSACLA
ncbi:Gfo/Idh/MocA family protein [Coraliomargarita parva]|uniref:Gfo/Idh/MocA family protein n=1 Tax=Coraliomargarita parva TaxID=3014050 RepID=UPI0022B5A40D|nr:Gfo/Idh/MocA family oxidoreductase [Coraliomargarita parva]